MQTTSKQAPSIGDKTRKCDKGTEATAANNSKESVIKGYQHKNAMMILKNIKYLRGVH